MSFVEIDLGGKKIIFRKANEKYGHYIKKNKKESEICVCYGGQILETYPHTHDGLNEMVQYVMQKYHLDISVYIPE